MAITVSNKRYDVIGSARKLIADITFDSSYASGGEALTKSTLGFIGVDSFVITPTYRKGVSFRYDYTNEKIQVLSSAPPIVHEELVAITAGTTYDTGYLKYPAAHINYIAAAAQNYIPIAGGVNPATTQCAVDMGYNDTTGVLTKETRTKLTFLGTDSVTAVYVSYATQAWTDLQDNMAMGKCTGATGSVTANFGDGIVFAAGTPDKIALGTDIIAMQSITWSDGGDTGTIKVPELLKDGGVPAATLETEIDFIKSSNAEVNTYAADAIDTSGDIMRFVYIKYPASGFLRERFKNAGITHSSDVIIFTGNPLIYGSCGQLPMTTSDKKAYWIKGTDTLAAGEIKWTHLPHFLNDNSSTAPSATCEASTDETVVPAWITGEPGEIDLQDIQVPNGTNLSSVTAKIEVVGR